MRLAHALVAVLLLLLQALDDHGLVRLGDLRGQRPRRRRRQLQVTDQHLAEARARKRQPAGGHLVHHAAQAVDVAAGVDARRHAAGLLRRHVRGRAHDHARLRLAGGYACVVGDAGDAEVHDLDEVLLPLVDRQVDVVRLEVAVDDLAVVRRLQGLADLDEDGARDLQQHGSVGKHQILKRLPVQELHDEVVAVVVGDVEVEDLEDVVVADDVDRARLVEEAIDDLLVVGVLRVQELDGDLRPDRRVLGHVDGAHPALPEELDDPVRADRVPDQVVRYPAREAHAVLRAVEDVVVVGVVAVGAGPGHGIPVESPGCTAVKQPPAPFPTGLC